MEDHIGLILYGIVFLLLLIIGLLVAVTLPARARRNKEVQRLTEIAKDYPALTTDFQILCDKLAKQNGSRVITVIHDLDFEREKGRDNLSQFIKHDEAFSALEQIRSADRDQPIDVILHTMGGYARPAEMIAEALNGHRGETTAYVPYIAMSGGTMIALACKKIVMGKYAGLGPIDSQYWGCSIDELVRLREEKKEKVSDEFLLVSYRAEKAERNAKERACALLNKAHDKNDNCNVTNWLMDPNKTHHGLRITLDEAKEEGINVALLTQDLIYKILDTRLRALSKAPEQGSS